jgi:putative ABC transport system permease protein
VIAEVALSLVLLIGAGLLTHSFARVQGVAPGFDSANVLTMRIALPDSRYTTFQKGNAFFSGLRRVLPAGAARHAGRSAGGVAGRVA